MAWYNKPKQTPIVAGSIDKDVTLPADATDTVQSVCWSPVSDLLAAASWDGKTRVYQVAKDGSGRGVAQLNAEGPLFSCDWSKDGSLVAAAGADKKVHILHAISCETMSFAAHDAPVREVRFVDVPNAAAPIIASGSWDKTVRYWDIRNTSQPLGQLQCNERVYAMDTAGQALVIATAAMTFHVVDLANPTVIVRDEQSATKHQIRNVSVSPNGKIWASGTIDGRTSVIAVDPKAPKNITFTFKCHRSPQADAAGVTKVWAVNSVSHHPTRESLVATAGSDGTFNFWDVEKKQRIKGFPSVGGAVTSCAFDRTGSWFAYAVGYDWSMGHKENKVDYPIGLRLHPVLDEDIHKEMNIRK